MKLSHLVISAFIGSSSSMVLAGAPGACQFAKYNVCVESSTADIETDCKESAAQGGKFIAKCPTDNRFASCKVTEGTDIGYIRYYKGFSADDAKKGCADNNGEYTKD